MSYRVFIVDDHPVVLRGLRQVFDAELGFSVCGVASGVAQTLSSVPDLVPDLVVTDLTLEGRSGLELTQQLAAHYPDLPVLILSMHDEQLYAQRALAAGARGYVMKRHSEDEVIRAAREVISGRVYVSEAIQKQMQPLRSSEEPSNGSSVNVLTEREMEVFLLIGEGYAPRHIADRLSLSVNTVEVYRERIKDKLSLESSPLLTRYAVRWCKDHDLP